MDYKEMWEQLKGWTERDYELACSRCIFAQVDRIDQEQLGKLRMTRDLLCGRLQQMVTIEDKQAKTSREEIDHALYKLVYDNAMRKFHIRRLVFTKGSKTDMSTYEEHRIERYSDYCLFQNGKGWFIVFYNEGERVDESFYFDKVTIEYNNKQEIKKDER